MLTEKKVELLRFLIKGSERESTSVFNSMLSTYGLTTNQAEVLLILFQSGPLSLKELGQLLICEKGSPSRLVQSLINKGFVDKLVNKKDRRKNVLSLTEKGKLLVPDINEASHRLNLFILQQIDDASLIDQLIKIFKTYLSQTDSGAKIKRRYPEEWK